MSGSLLWSGLFLLVAGPHFGLVGVFALLGALLMAIGIVLMWLGK